MMVKQTRIIFDLADVLALRLHCEVCGRETVQPLAATQVPTRCPICHEEWEVPGPRGNRGPNYALVHYMRELLVDESPRMTIRFEIDGGEPS